MFFLFPSSKSNHPLDIGEFVGFPSSTSAVICRGHRQANHHIHIDFVDASCNVVPPVIIRGKEKREVK